MPTLTVGVFTVNYTLFTNAVPHHDIQFGMDFTVTTTGQKPLSQLIFPATAVGTNIPNRWNVDNHVAPGSIDSIIFGNAAHGTITDGPRELAKPGGASMRTKFAVFIVDKPTNSVQKNGIAFSYSINPSAHAPLTVFDGCQPLVMTNEQVTVLKARYAQLEFV